MPFHKYLSLLLFEVRIFTIFVYKFGGFHHGRVDSSRGRDCNFLAKQYILPIYGSRTPCPTIKSYLKTLILPIINLSRTFICRCDSNMDNLAQLRRWDGCVLGACVKTCSIWPQTFGKSTHTLWLTKNVEPFVRIGSISSPSRKQNVS